MDKLEILEQIVSENDIEIIDNYIFESPRIKGLYSNNVIAVSKAVKNPKEKSCILAEELGHYHTSSGNIIDMHDIRSRKQEYKARLWAYNQQVGLIGIIKAFEYSCKNLFEMAEYLDVTENFLIETIECYKRKYGIYTKVDNYVIYFDPCLAVMKIF